jgi:hypothetical protein
MKTGCIISFPCWFLFHIANEDAKQTHIYRTNEDKPVILKTFNPCFEDYIGIGLVSLGYSFLTGIMTPFVLYSSPIWLPIYFLNKYKQKQEHY